MSSVTATGQMILMLSNRQVFFFGRASGKTAVIAATSADNGTGGGTDNSNGDSIDGPPALKICRALLVKGKSCVRFLQAALVFSK